MNPKRFKWVKGRPGSILHRSRNTPLFQLLDVDNVPPSLANLPARLTLGGVDSYPTARYRGADASTAGWPAWDYGVDLSYDEQDGRNDYEASTPLLGADDVAVRFSKDAGTYPDRFEATGSQMDPSPVNKCLVVEFIARLDASTLGQNIISRNNQWITGTVRGWSLSAYSSGNVYFSAGDGTQYKYLDTVAGAASKEFVHILMAYRYNGDETAQVYTAVNGNRDATIASAGPIGDITPTDPESANTRLGWTADGMDLAYLATWAPECGELDFDELDDIAMERHQRLTGWWPLEAAGQPHLESWSRASAATVRAESDSGELTLTEVAEHWPRVAKHGTDIGALIEPPATNLIPYSCDLSNAAWTKNGSATAAKDQTGPTGLPNSASRVTGLANGATDSIAVAVTTGLTASGEVAVGLALRKSTAAGTLSLVATTGAGSWDIDIEGLDADTWYWIDRESSLVTVNTEFAADASGDLTLALQNASATPINVDVCAVQLQDTGDYLCTSPILTAGAAATRLAEAPYFKGDDGNVPAGTDGMLLAQSLIPASRARYTGIVAVNDGGSGSDTILLDSTPDGNPRAYVRATAGSDGDITGSADVADGEFHELQLNYSTDDQALYTDGSADGTDATADVPDDLDRIYPGTDGAGSYHHGGLIKNIRIFGKNLKKVIS